MTVPAQATLFNESVANGVTTSFPYQFMIATADDIAVELDGVVTTTGFTVTGVGNANGGGIDFSVAPANGVKVLRYLDSELSRTEEDYQQFGDFNADTVDREFDRIWLAMQSLALKLGLCVRAPISSASGILPQPAANQVIGWNEDATGFKNFAPADNTLLSVFLESVEGAARIGVKDLAGLFAGSTVESVLEEIGYNASRNSMLRRHQPFANDYSGPLVVRDGSADTFPRHFGGIAEGTNGRLHLVYGKNSEHAATAGATSYYTHSDDGGYTWSTETVVIPVVAGADQRSLSLCVTPTGRVLLAYAEVVVPNVTTTPTTIRTRYSDDNGITWQQGPDIVTIPYTYCRAYGRIKVVPGSNRLVTTPYYRSDDVPNYKVATWFSDDNGESWTEGEPIFNDADGKTENEIVAISAQVWFAATRSGTGIKISKTVNGGVTWALVGTVPNTTTDSYVAPTIDKFYRNGLWYVLLGYCDRVRDTLTWRVCDVASLFSDTSKFSYYLDSATDMVNASGYQSPIVRPDGCVYWDEGTGFIEFKEYVGFDYSQVRFRRADLESLLREAGRQETVASGAISLPVSDLDYVIYLDTEGAAATDDLDTINGGREGQITVFRSNVGTSSRDVILKSGTGNIRLRGDFRMNDITNSAISLMHINGIWYELARSADQTATALTIAAGIVTAPYAPGLLTLLIDTEGAAATDDLDTINGGQEGQVAMFFSATSSRDITFKDGTGNLSLAGDFLLSNAADNITLVKRGSTWYEIGRSDNA